jgi:hypothetical protein
MLHLPPANVADVTVVIEFNALPPTFDDGIRYAVITQP